MDAAALYDQRYFEVLQLVLNSTTVGKHSILRVYFPGKTFASYCSRGKPFEFHLWVPPHAFQVFLHPRGSSQGTSVREPGFVHANRQEPQRWILSWAWHRISFFRVLYEIMENLQDHFECWMCWQTHPFSGCWVFGICNRGRWQVKKRELPIKLFSVQLDNINKSSALERSDIKSPTSSWAIMGSTFQTKNLWTESNMETQGFTALSACVSTRLQPRSWAVDAVDYHGPMK